MSEGGKPRDLMAALRASMDEARVLAEEREAHARTARELGGTRARLRTESVRLAAIAEQFLYDGDSDRALPGYVEVYGVADALAALGATDG